MGFLGHTYPGMLDMYSDFTMITAQTGMHVEVLEMCDLAKLAESVTDAEKQAKLEQVKEMFVLSEDSPSDPLARKPRPEQLDVACRVAVAQEKMVREFDLDALTYYYRGRDGNPYEQLQEAFILGHSLLTAQGIPCSGEGDMKTAIAMKICDMLGVGGSYSEIVAADYDRGTIILGHDGPFHIAIADGKPILRGMGLYHGKWGTGVSVEATVRKGPVTLLNVTQTGDGKLRMIANQGRGYRGTDSEDRQHDDPRQVRPGADADDEPVVRIGPHAPRCTEHRSQHGPLSQGLHASRNRLPSRFTYRREVTKLLTLCGR